MFAFNMMASGVNAFQAAAPKLDVIHERAKKTASHVRRAASFSRTRSQSVGPNDISSQQVETGRSVAIEDDDDDPEPFTYRRKVTREYSPEATRGRRDTRRIERRRSPDLDSEASLSPPPRRRIKDAPRNELAGPNNNQLVVRSKSKAGSPPSNSPSRSKKSRSPSVSSSEEDLPNSSEDEREEKKKKRAAQVMTGVSAIATVNAAANFWLSVKASHERDQKLRDGKMTAEEARKEKLKNQAQDIASIGAAVLTVKVVRNRWKMTADQKNAAITHRKERAERRDKRRQRDVEWEIESVETESEEEMAIARERGRSEMGRARRPGPPARLMSYSDDEYDRGQRGFHDRYDRYYDRRPPPRRAEGSVQGSYAGSSHGGSNSGKHRSSKSKKRDSDEEDYVENAYYDMGYNAPQVDPDSHHHHHHHHHGSKDRRDRAHSVYSYDDRDRYDDYRPSRRHHRDGSKHGGKDKSYREGESRNDAMMNLGNF